MEQLDDGSNYVPDYQRDSSQWDLEKKSLFVDSLINNMTIPPLIVYPETDKDTGAEKHQIVDGQQRLTTIRDYLKGAFAVAPEAEVEYADNVGPIIQGKRFNELPDAMQKQIKRYTLNIILLPKDLELSLRLEIFRRINEAGVPLSPHDLRLAVFGRSNRVYLIRLAGVFDPTREGAARMIKAAKDQFGLELPMERSQRLERLVERKCTRHRSSVVPDVPLLHNRERHKECGRPSRKREASREHWCQVRQNHDLGSGSLHCSTAKRRIELRIAPDCG